MLSQSRAASGPLRKNINRQFDALLLGEPENPVQARQHMATTIRAREQEDFGRFTDGMGKQRKTALHAEALLLTAQAEFEQDGTVSPATSRALEAALEALYLATVQANASFHVEKLPIENAKYAFLQAWDLHVSLTQNRRPVISILRNGVLARADALRFLQQVERPEQQLLRFRTMAKSIDWERTAQFIEEYAAPVEQYLAQPVL